MTALAGRRALVTGGGAGVGEAIARSLAAAGAEVWIAGRSAAPLRALAEAVGGIAWVRADVTDEASIAAMFAAAGPVDIVVANAGIAASAPFARTTLEGWDRIIAVNLTGVFLTFRDGLRQMPEGWGRLIAVASTMGLRGDAYIAPYAASKHGVVGLTRSLAKEVARRGITANALCPGYVDTPMTDRSVQNIVDKTGMDAEAARARLIGANPAGRLVRPEEVAAAALWLCSEGAAMVNGQAIALSGGEI